MKCIEKRSSGVAVPLLALALAVVFSAAACQSSASGKSAGTYEGKVSYKLVVEGFEWGPSVTKLILTAEDDFQAATVSRDGFVVKTTPTVAEGEATTYVRRITEAYICDAEGNRASGSSKSIALDLASGYETLMTIPGVGNVGAAIDGSAAFSYSSETGYNTWADLATYTVELAEGKTLGLGGAEYAALSVSADSYAGRLVPETAVFTKSSLVSDSITLQTAAYEPAALKGDAGQNALIVWLHGAGEGGTDVDIVLLGNDVTELSKEPIQGYFKSDGLAGAYVLAVQTPTRWMDNGAGQHSGDEDSLYTAALKEAIDQYIVENADVDAGRVYLGGCSNGGYMTVNMLINYPEFFAAGYPICEAYMDSFIDEEKLERLMVTPIWFTTSADDSVLAPSEYTVRTYTRLLLAGAEDVHLSYFEEVQGQDEPGLVYMGHWSWIYTLQDRSVLDQDAVAIKAAEDVEAALALVSAPSTEPVQVNGADVTLWAWLAAQRKAR